MKSFIPWIGGKSLLAKKIVSMFPDDFDRYIEVFGGGGSVLFAKDKHAPLEVYNDANGQLVNLFRCIRFHREELQREISGYINAREIFEDIKAQINGLILYWDSGIQKFCFHSIFQMDNGQCTQI